MTGARLSLAAAVAALAIVVPATAAPQPGPAYTDGMVLQRGEPIVVAGTARPGETVSGSLGEARATARADDAGAFAIRFPARAESAQPLELTLADSTGTTRLGNIVVGDVWLCSGQSNMEFPVERSIAGPDRIKSSRDPLLRLLAVPKATALAPAGRFGDDVKWVAAGPETVPTFSAACFYMAQKLRADLAIPIGVIGSYWGGSQIRAWLSPEAGEALFGQAQMRLLDRYADDPLGATTAFAPEWEAWWQAHEGNRPWAQPDTVDWQPVPAIAPWSEWKSTKLADDPARNVLLRRTVDLTSGEAAKDATLSIGIIDDGDMTFVNGHPVGNTFSWDQERHYRVPARFLREGANEILVVASNGWGPGGFQSGADRLSLALTGGRSIPLDDGWLYAVAEERGGPPRAPWDTIAGIGGMHNAMIAPLGPMRLAGAAWYQGESDAGIAGYDDRLTALLAGWRARFGQQMRMLVVQLPDFGARQASPAPSGWAEVREAERAVVAADPNAALASAIDQGAWDELHPPHKLEVGRRLAMGAMKQPMPMPTGASRVGNSVVVTFDGVEGGLRTFSGPRPLGVELCGPQQDDCRWAAARVGENRLVIADDARPASRIRYAWADAPIVNLFDARGLPVPGFELAIEP